MKQLSQVYLFLLLVAGISGCSTLGYYQQAIGGHLALMMKSQPVADYVSGNQIATDLKNKLAIAREARQFARIQLALPVGDAFTEYVELDRPWVLVNLVAVPEFSLDPHRWCYPVLGCQAYRGYFDLEDARAEQAQFADRGYDTFIGGVTAYSTLGWFDDPLHTGFTALPEARMVALMFHELAHRVVYVDADTAFNESFATAVELEGLKLWLDRRGQPEQFELSLARLRQRHETLALVAEATGQLQPLYQQRDRLPLAELRRRKEKVFEQLQQAYDRRSQGWDLPGPFGPSPVTLNNANLALLQQYNQYVPGFRQLWRDQQRDFPAFYRAVNRLAEQPENIRKAQLDRLSERFKEDF